MVQASTHSVKIFDEWWQCGIIRHLIFSAGTVGRNGEPTHHQPSPTVDFPTPRVGEKYVGHYIAFIILVKCFVYAHWSDGLKKLNKNLQTDMLFVCYLNPRKRIAYTNKLISFTAWSFNLKIEIYLNHFIKYLHTYLNRKDIVCCLLAELRLR